MKRPAIFSLLISLFVLSACVNIVRPNFSPILKELRSGEYTLDPEHAYVSFKIGHLGLSKIVGRFNVVAGSLEFDPEKINELKLQGIIAANSIDVNNDDLESTLQDSDWLNSVPYPQITFISESVIQVENELLVITGNLSIAGMTKSVELSARFNGGADNILTGKYTLGFSASTLISRSNFGIDKWAALVADEVEIELHGEFQKN